MIRKKPKGKGPVRRIGGVLKKSAVSFLAGTLVLTSLTFMDDDPVETQAASADNMTIIFQRDGKNTVNHNGQAEGTFTYNGIDGSGVSYGTLNLDNANYYGNTDIHVNIGKTKDLYAPSADTDYTGKIGFRGGYQFYAAGGKGGNLTNAQDNQTALRGSSYGGYGSAVASGTYDYNTGTSITYRKGSNGASYDGLRNWNYWYPYSEEKDITSDNLKYNNTKFYAHTRNEYRSYMLTAQYGSASYIQVSGNNYIVAGGGGAGTVAFHQRNDGSKWVTAQDGQHADRTPNVPSGKAYFNPTSSDMTLHYSDYVSPNVNAGRIVGTGARQGVQATNGQWYKTDIVTGWLADSGTYNNPVIFEKTYPGYSGYGTRNGNVITPSDNAYAGLAGVNMNYTGNPYIKLKCDYKIVVINNPTRPGFNFTGWTNLKNCQLLANSNGQSTFKVTGTDSSIEATWSSNSYTLTINPNGGMYYGTAANTVKTLQAESNYEVNGAPTKENYIFQGWKRTGSGSLHSGTVEAINSMIKVAEKADSDGTAYTNYSMNVTNNGGDTWWPGFTAFHYPYTPGHTYRLSYDVRVNNSSGLVYSQIRNAGFDNNYDQTYCIFVDDFNKVTNGWEHRTIDRTFQSTTTQNGTAYTTNPVVEFYCGVAVGKTGKFSFDLKNVTVYDVTAGTYVTSKSSNVKNGSTLTMGAGDTTLTAMWKPATYGVKFDGNGAEAGSMSDFSGSYNTIQDLPANAYSKAGYKFLGWNTKPDGTGISYTDKEKINFTDSSYTDTTGYQDDGMYVIRSKANNSIVLDVYNADSNSAANIQVWTQNWGLAQNFQLKHVGNGRYKIENQNSGLGFNVANVGTTNGTNVIQWPYFGNPQEKWYFEDAGDGSVYITNNLSNKVLSYDGTYENNPSAGLNIGIWEKYGGNNQKYILDKVSSSLYNGTTLYAQWEKDTYTVSYDAKGGTNKKADLNGDYTFSFGDGKYLKDENGYAGGNASVGKKDETSQWTLEKSAEGMYYVINKATGNVLYTESVTETDTDGKTYTREIVKVGPQQQAKRATNYNYLWDVTESSDGTVELENAENENVLYRTASSDNLYCDEQPAKTDHEYGLAMTATGSKMDYPDRTKAGSNNLYVNEIAPEKTGYKFLGWNTKEDGSGDMYQAGDLYNSTCSSDKLTLYAQWQAITYTINYDGNKATGGSTASSTHTYDVAKKLTKNGYERTGYHFIGWNTKANGKGDSFEDEQSVKNLTTKDGDVITLYAQWKRNTCNVKIIKGDHVASATGDGDYAPGEEVTISAKADNGYEIVGWEGTYNTTDNPYKFPMPEQDVEETVTAQPIQYQIRYEYNGGTADPENPSDYNIETPDFTLNNPTKEGYEFEGWTGSNGDTPQKTVTIPKGSTGDLNYVANWKPIQYVIHFDGNGATSGSTPDVTGTYDEDVTIPENGFERETDTGKSKFLGWSTDPNSTDPEYKPGDVVKNLTNVKDEVITVYAIWDDCPDIEAHDLYYTLTQAQNGDITENELLSYAKATDREDGEISPGADLEKGTAFTVWDYQAEDFINFQHEGSVTETYQVIDSQGNIFQKQITVYVVDTTPKEVANAGTTRFINKKYFNKTALNGGLADDSLWRTDAEYNSILRSALENLENDTSEKTYHFTHEDILNMKQFIKDNGVGNSRSADALTRFYETFMR